VKPADCSEEDWEEQYFYSVRTLANAVDVLLLSPEDALVQLGGWNSAWELKEDLVENGRMLLDIWPERLQPDCLALLRDLVDAASQISSYAIRTDGDPGENLKLLSIPGWARPRSIASRLAPLLAGAPADSRRYFGE
jgi:hypothetical protein